MPETVTNELLYEVLKNIQQRLDRHEHMLKEIHATQIRIREDINGARGDSLRIERQFGALELRLDRIETRLNLADA